MRRPWASKRLLICPVKFRRVASGLMIERVRSVAMTGSSGRKGSETEAALYPALRGAATRPPAADQPPALPPELPAGLGLAEIFERVAGVLGLLVAHPCGLGRGLVAAVEDLDAALEHLGRCDRGAIRQHHHGGTVRVLVTVGQPDRLVARVALAR